MAKTFNTAKAVIVGIRISRDEKVVLEQQAELAGLKLSEFVRSRLFPPSREEVEIKKQLPKQEVVIHPTPQSEPESTLPEKPPATRKRSATVCPDCARRGGPRQTCPLCKHLWEEQVSKPS